MSERNATEKIRSQQNANEIKSRQRWMGVLARASIADLETYWKEYGEDVAYDLLREPECGLVMVRGRAGGDGQKFNLGEMSVTRCSVRLKDGIVGHSYIAGRNRQQAEIAAAFDALLQNPTHHEDLSSRVIDPLERKDKARRDERSRKAAATKVDFFTMVRGEDE